MVYSSGLQSISTPTWRKIGRRREILVVSFVVGSSLMSTTLLARLLSSSSQCWILTLSFVLYISDG